MVIILLPTLSAIGPDAVPLATIVPFTVTVAAASVVVGVKVILFVVLVTEAVYTLVADVKVGLSVPELIVSFANVATVFANLVTVMVYVLVVVPS